MQNNEAFSMSFTGSQHKSKSRRLAPLKLESVQNLTCKLVSLRFLNLKKDHATHRKATVAC